MTRVKDLAAEAVILASSMETMMVDRRSFMPAPRSRGPARFARRWRALWGALLVAFGAVAVMGVFLAAFSEEPSLAALGLRLGLAWSTLVSGLGQTAVLIGLWLLWSGARRR